MPLVIFTLLFLLAWAAPAQAGFLVPLIAGAAFAASTAGVIAAAVANIALAMGVSYLANKLLAPKQRKPAGGVELDIRIDADVAQSLIVGRAVTAGSLVYGESHGEKNQHFVEGIAIADHPCVGLVKVFVDGQEVSWTTGSSSRGNTISSYVKGGREYLHFVFKDGSQTTADNFAVAQLGSHPQRPWTAAFIGRGVTYVRTNTMYEPELTPSPMRWRFVVDGIRLYDPRKDSTVAGGVGAHRFGNLATHEFSANLPLIAYNILRGIRVADHLGNPRHFYGLEGTPAAALPLDVWFAAMNEADALVDGEPQFHGGGEISVDTEPLEALREIVKAIDGRFVEVGGVYKLYVGAPGLPVLSFDDGVIRADDDDVFRPIRPLEQRINHVTGKYTSPDDGWVPKVAPPREFPGGVVVDGRRVSGDLDAPFIQSSNHVQRMMQQMLARARKERRHTLPLPPSCWGLEPGDIIEWTSARNGYIAKLFEVEAVEDYHDLSITVSIVELDETDYDWNATTDLIPEPDGTLVTNRPGPKVIAGFAATGVIHTANNGATRPAIRVTWTAPDDADSVAVNVQFRRAAVPGDVATASTDEPEAGEMLILSGLVSLTEYEVRGRFRSYEGKPAAWSLWIPVTTPDARISTADILDNAITAAKINNAAVTAAKLADEAVTLTKFASGIAPISLVASLPGTGTINQIVYLTSDNRLYTWNGSGWVATAAGLTAPVTTADIADLAITAAKVAASAITTAKIADAAVAAGKIAVAAVGTAHLDALAVTQAKVADAAIATAKIAAGAVGASQLAGSAVTTAKIADAAVAAAKLADGSVLEGKIATGAVVAEKIATGTITAGQIAANTVTAAQIAALTITASEIATDAITAAKILASAVTTVKLAAASVIAAKIAANTITATHIGAGAITAAEIAALTITASEIATDAVTAAKILAGAVTTVKLAANAVTAGKIAANTITAAQIAANTITAGEIAAGAINTDQLAASAVTAAKIAAGTISADLIASKAITVDKLMVTSFDNLWENAGFETGSLDPGTLVAAGGTFSNSAATPRSGWRHLLYTRAGQTGTAVITQTAEAAEGQAFYMEAWARGAGGAGTGIRCRFQWLDAAGLPLGASAGGLITPAGPYERMSVAAVAPAGTATVRFQIFFLNDGTQPSMRVDDVYVRRRFGGELVVDGSITGNKINANTITATNIVAGTITTSEIAVGGVATGNVAVGAITERAETSSGFMNQDTSGASTGVVLASVGMTFAADEEAVVWVNGVCTSNRNVTFGNRKDATLGDEGISAITDGTAPQFSRAYPNKAVRWSPGPGTHTFQISGRIGNAVATGNATVTGWLVAMKVKR